MTWVIFIVVCFLASTVGCICGIGGGVIIKPVLDAFGLYTASTISFVSGCIVLSMTGYSVIKAAIAREKNIEKGVSTYLGLGAAIGGIVGKLTLDGIKAATANDALVGSVQSVVLLVVTLGTLIYLLLERRIPTHHVHHWCACLGIGLLLGVISSFLGIGGGPINLVVLSFFFSMETKKAAQNSLFIILLSQSASLIFTLLRGTVPSFPPLLLAIMVLAGILGGVVGRRINKRIDAKAVRKLLVGLWQLATTGKLPEGVVLRPAA
mgnify:CR=1 FL=1